MVGVVPHRADGPLPSSLISMSRASCTGRMSTVVPGRLKHQPVAGKGTHEGARCAPSGGGSRTMRFEDLLRHSLHLAFLRLGRFTSAHVLPSRYVSLI